MLRHFDLPIRKKSGGKRYKTRGFPTIFIRRTSEVDNGDGNCRSTYPSIGKYY